MRAAERRKRVWLFLGVLSAVSIAAGVPLLAICALKLLYIPMVFLILFVGHGAYGIAYYFVQYARERAAIRCIPHIARAREISYAALGEKIGMTPEGARYTAERCIRLGYVRYPRKQ